MIVAVVAVGILFWLFYHLFIKGNVWPWLLLVFGVMGGKSVILNHFPESHKTIATFLSYDISYATFIATVIAVLGIGVIMEKVK